MQLDQLLSSLALLCLGIRPITSLSLSLRPLSFLADPSVALIIFFVSHFLRRRRVVIAVAIPSFPSLLHLTVRPSTGPFLLLHPFRSLSCRPHPLFPVILIFRLGCWKMFTPSAPSRRFACLLISSMPTALSGRSVFLVKASAIHDPSIVNAKNVVGLVQLYSSTGV